MTDLQKTPFVRELASSDRKTRDKALASLTLFLRSRTDLSLLELLKLWKGLFFCFYHSDRPLTQQALARTLSYSLVPTLPRSSVHRFLRAFWITIGRDFHLIDRLRLDKYLFLIRCYIGVGFEVFLKEGLRGSALSSAAPEEKNEEKEEGAANGNMEDGKKRKSTSGSNKKKKQKQNNHGHGQRYENEENEANSNNNNNWSDLSSYLSILEEGPLCPLDFDPDQKPIPRQQQQQASPGSDTDSNTTIFMPHGPDGLRYHIMDIWIDELEKIFEFDDDDNDENHTSTNSNADTGEKGRKLKNKDIIPMDLLLRPIERLRTESPYKPVRTRAGATLDDERLFEWGFKNRKKDDENESEDEEWGGFD